MQGKERYKKLSDKKLKEIQEAAQADFNIADEVLQFVNIEMDRRGFEY